MPDLLLELFSEEIPARMQRQAADDLKRLVTGALVEADVTLRGRAGFATPRRLALHVVGLPAAQPDRREERKGPRVGAPEGAIAGLSEERRASRASRTRKSCRTARRASSMSRSSRSRAAPTRELIAEMLPAILRAFPWPKSMRWGAASARAEALRWVRPLRSIVCTFGARTRRPRRSPSRSTAWRRAT